MKRRDKTTIAVPPSQASLMDQIKLLVDLANQNGLYDAADWLMMKLNNPRRL